MRRTPIHEPDLLPQIVQVALPRKHEPPVAAGLHGQGRAARRRDRDDGHDGALVRRQLGQVLVQRVAEHDDARRVGAGGGARAEVGPRVPGLAEGGVQRGREAQRLLLRPAEGVAPPAAGPRVAGEVEHGDGGGAVGGEEGPRRSEGVGVEDADGLAAREARAGRGRQRGQLGGHEDALEAAAGRGLRDRGRPRDVVLGDDLARFQVEHAFRVEVHSATWTGE